MAMWSTGGGGGVVREVYEDLRPVSEWQQDDESHILNIYLPGFTKEQIKVSTHGRNTLRVRGQRLVAGNKWSRFQEEFQVPENGEMNSVRAKYQGGILSITVQKRKIYKTQDAQKGQAPESSTSSQATDEKRTEPQNLLTSDPRTKHNQDSDQKGQEKAFSASQSTEKKSVVEPQTDQGGDQRSHGRVTPLRSTGAVVSHDTEKRESSESKEKHIASDHATNKTGDTEGKDIISRNEPPEFVEMAKNTKSGKHPATVVPENNADNNELNAAFTKEKYKKAVKGLTELNEERQLLVNTGVAVLVIVALTAYATYSFASAKNKN